MAPVRYGATPEEWARLKRLAKVDLLPVVSNPAAEISPRSKMKGKGKTPSLYNHSGLVSGFPDWTDHETTVRNIEAWAEQPDYGICIQTRRVRGFDIDVPDRKLAKAIRRAFLEALRRDDLPRRFRADSGKELLAFVLEGDEWAKRSFVVKEWRDEDTAKIKRWIVEFLAEGQQFIAAGTHTEGARYEWDGGLPDEFPVISAKAFERAWQAVVDEFALEGTDRRSQRRDPTLVEDLEVEDPVAEYLIESEWPTYDIHRGMLYLDCPWKDGHSSDNGETETAWMLAGTGKYRNGHFSCRHAGCSGRSDADFLNAVGYRPAKAEEFEDLSTDDGGVALYLSEVEKASAKPKPLPLPGFERDSRGRIVTKMENVVRALRSYQVVKCDLAFDRFRGEMMLADEPNAWRGLTDADVVELLMRLERLPFVGRIPTEMIRLALVKLEAEHQFDSAQLWLSEVIPEWDGVSRIHRFYPDYLMTADTPYTRALGNYSWTAQAGRILEPGLQVDMVPVLVGAEGLRKTSALKAMVPAKEFYGEFNMSKDDIELARLMRGKLVGELAELRGISARDGEAIKAWITRTDEEWTPKYRERSTALARRVVFYGTSNDDDFLQAHMGERRWAPVTVLSVIDTDRIARDRPQLWAEARDTFVHDGGLAWERVERFARGERDAFRHVDPWTEQVARWLDDEWDLDSQVTPRASGKLRSEDVLIHCLGISVARIGKPDQNRVGAVLRACGMIGTQRKIDGRTTRVWIDARAQSSIGPRTAMRLPPSRKAG